MGRSWHAKIKQVLGSRLFLVIVLAAFAVQAGIVAVTGSYPMAFDESYHLGIIQLYAQQWSPYFSHLSTSAAPYGALATDPSYLYHYLFSFIYRFILLFTGNLFAVVVTLRFINVALFIAGLWLFRKAFDYTSISRAVANLSVAAFSLLPLESFTAAQINYDNAIFACTGGAMLLTLRLLKEMKEKKQIPILTLGWLSAVCLFAAQVKYVFLPIMLGIYAFLAVMIAWQWRQTGRAFLHETWQRLRTVSILQSVLLASVLLLALISFGWRYGYNVTRYHSLTPDCARVVNVQACLAYGPWSRNYRLAQTHVTDSSLLQLRIFTRAWLHIMATQIFAVVNAVNGANEPPVRRLVLGSYALFAGGLICLLFVWRRLLTSGAYVWLFLTIGAVYTASLFLKNYGEFTRFGIPIAVQGRYLLPILLPLMVLILQAYSAMLRERQTVKLAVLMLALLVLSQGGGATTYLLRSHGDSWHWQSSAINVSLKR